MPIDSSEFPPEVQQAFFVLSMLSDAWDGMSGAYLGKNWTDIQFIFDTYKIEDRHVILYFAKMYERLLIQYRAEEAEKRRKAEERKSKAGGGGKNFAHNVRG